MSVTFGKVSSVPLANITITLVKTANVSRMEAKNMKAEACLKGRLFSSLEMKSTLNPSQLTQKIGKYV